MIRTFTRTIYSSNVNSYSVSSWLLRSAVITPANKWRFLSSLQTAPADSKIIIISQRFNNNFAKLSALKTYVGTSSFKELRFSDSFIDKSELISTFDQGSDKVCLNTFPRRFLKSSNLSMLKEFYRIEVDAEGNPLPKEQCQNSPLFIGGEVRNLDKEIVTLDPLKITDYPKIMKKQGSLPVISVDLKNISGNSYEDCLVKLREALHNTYFKHKYLCHSLKLTQDEIEVFKQYSEIENYRNLAKDQVESGLNLLTRLLYSHFEKPVIILIDEYDTAINKAYLNPNSNCNEADKIIDLHRSILSSTLKGNEYLYKGLVTGVLRIAKADILSDFNNAREYSMGDPLFTRYYGFNQEEVDSLITKYQIPEDLAVAMKDWYNGYDGGHAIYNPWSIVNALSSFQNYLVDPRGSREKIVLRNYWQESGNFDFMTPLLKQFNIQEDVKQLATNKAIGFNLNQQISVKAFMKLKDIVTDPLKHEITSYGRNILYSYIYAAGYLTPTGEEDCYRAPNKEIRDAFTRSLTNYYKKNYKTGYILHQKLADKLQNILQMKDGDTYEEKTKHDFKEALENILNSLPEFVRINRHEISPVKSDSELIHANKILIQVILSYTVMQVLSGTKFGVEVYLGQGRTDCLLINDRNKKAIIFELKYNQHSADDALLQIAEKEYGKPIPKDYTLINIGLNVDFDKSVTTIFEVKSSNIGIDTEEEQKHDSKLSDDLLTEFSPMQNLSEDPTFELAGTIADSDDCAN